MHSFLFPLMESLLSSLGGNHNWQCFGGEKKYLKKKINNLRPLQHWGIPGYICRYVCLVTNNVHFFLVQVISGVRPFWKQRRDSTKTRRIHGGFPASTTKLEEKKKKDQCAWIDDETFETQSENPTTTGAHVSHNVAIMNEQHSLLDWRWCNRSRRGCSPLSRWSGNDRLQQRCIIHQGGVPLFFFPCTITTEFWAATEEYETEEAGGTAISSDFHHAQTHIYSGVLHCFTFNKGMFQEE